MAVKLSSVATGSYVNLPLAAGGVMPCIVIGQNHYGAGETDLMPRYRSRAAILNEFSVSSSRTQTMDAETWASNVYQGSPFDLFLNDEFLRQFSDGVIGSLIQVSVPVISQFMCTRNSFAGITSTPSISIANIKRSIFLPSAAEIGFARSGGLWRSDYNRQSGGSNSDKQGFRVMNIGSVFPWLNSTSTVVLDYRYNISTSSCTRRWLCGACRDPVIIGGSYYHSGSGTSASCGSTRFMSPMWNELDSSWYDFLPTNTAYGENDDYRRYDIPSNAVYNNLAPIICLNGSCMVNSTSGGDFTGLSAVETYRKIDGVWYRTI